MLCPFSTDVVPEKIESSECLYWTIMVYMQLIKRQVVLPCCSAVLELDAVPLHHQSCFRQDREWWVSILIDISHYAVDQTKRCLTMFFCSIWATGCANLSPILLPERLRTVSVYMKTYIKSNAFKWLKVVVSQSFRNHFLLLTTLLNAGLDWCVNAVLHKEKHIIRACLSKGTMCVVMLYVRYCLRLLECLTKVEIV
jgi:hypothetical protein